MRPSRLSLALRHTLAAAALAMVAFPLWAQPAAGPGHPTFGPLLTAYLHQPCPALAAHFAPTPTATGERIELLATCTDAASAIEAVSSLGRTAKPIDSHTLTLWLPSSRLDVLGTIESLTYAEMPRRAKLRLDKALPDIGADKVTAGEGIETPFTGKGVVVGIIDTGFEYRHPAFAQRPFRIVLPDADTVSTIVPAEATDHAGQEHATHVAGIATGARSETLPVCGVAPEATLVMAPSELTSTQILRQAKAIKQYAEAQGCPWVINMSFGSMLGPHDGRSPFSQSMDSLMAHGGFMVAAAGNEAGCFVHASHDFEADGAIAYLAFRPQTDGIIHLQLWSSTTDGSSPLAVRPALWYKGKIYPFSTAPTAALEPLTDRYSLYDAVQSYNGKQLIELHAACSDLFAVARDSLPLSASESTVYYLLEVAGQRHTGFHAWLDYDYYDTEFCSLSLSPFAATQVMGDDRFLVCEDGACIERAIAVGAYTGRSSWTSLSGHAYNVSSGSDPLQSLCYFSSAGPSLCSTPKPSVAAPGAYVLSSLSKQPSIFRETSAYVTRKVAGGGESFYYGLKSGTSMSTPMVTGAVALWLEACPTLTHEQLASIIRTTSRRDELTGTGDAEGWDEPWGYGTLDVYEGLKQAHVPARQSGTTDALLPASPFTLSRQGSSYRVLLNHQVSSLRLTLYGASGQRVQHRSLTDVRAGSELEVPLHTLAPGVYLLELATPTARLTRKIVVR